LNASSPRFRASGKCAGCGELFADLDAFTLHATGKLEPTPGARRRCRGPAEMKACGMHQQRGTVIWTLTKGHGRA
jgi:hypothetical protein